MATVMGPSDKLTQADVAVNYYVVLNILPRWGDAEIQRSCGRFDEAYGPLMPRRLHERAFWHLRRRAREVLLGPLRKDYDVQRRLWLKGAHGSLNNIVLLDFGQLRKNFLDEETSVWTCLFSYLYHCTELRELEELANAPHLLIVAHFLWASRAVLLRYERECAEDPLTDSIPGSWGVSPQYLQAVSGPFIKQKLMTTRYGWLRLLEILSEHDSRHSVRVGERRAWFWFGVKLFKSIGVLDDEQLAALLELEGHLDLGAWELARLGAKLVFLARDLARQIPFLPEYYDACAITAREPEHDIEYPWLEGDDLAQAFDGWFTRVRDRIASSQAMRDWSGEDLAALWGKYFQDTQRVFQFGVVDRAPRPRWLYDRAVIRAETETALAQIREEEAREGETPPASPFLTATHAASSHTVEGFDLECRRRSDEDREELAWLDEAAYRAEKRRGKMKAWSGEGDGDDADDSLSWFSSSEESTTLEEDEDDYLHAWRPAFEENVEIWRPELGYEHQVPQVSQTTMETLKNTSVLEHAETLVRELRDEYEQAVWEARNPVPVENPYGLGEASGSGETLEDKLRYAQLADESDNDVQEYIAVITEDGVAIMQDLQPVVAPLDEEEFEVVNIADQVDSTGRPQSREHYAATSTSEDSTEASLDDDPFASHWSCASFNRSEGAQEAMDRLSSEEAVDSDDEFADLFHAPSRLPKRSSNQMTRQNAVERQSANSRTEELGSRRNEKNRNKSYRAIPKYADVQLSEWDEEDPGYESDRTVTASKPDRTVKASNTGRAVKASSSRIRVDKDSRIFAEVIRWKVMIDCNPHDFFSMYGLPDCPSHQYAKARSELSGTSNSSAEPRSRSSSSVDGSCRTLDYGAITQDFDGVEHRRQ